MIIIIMINNYCSDNNSYDIVHTYNYIYNIRTVYANTAPISPWMISKCFETMLDISGPHSRPMPQVAYPDASDGVFMCLGGIAESSLPAGAKLSH